MRQGPTPSCSQTLSLQNGHFANLANSSASDALSLGHLHHNHPNNTGHKPILIGQEEIVRSQMNYIYRGNYGLISLQEIERLVSHPICGPDDENETPLPSAISAQRRIYLNCIVRDERWRPMGFLFVDLASISTSSNYEGDSVRVDLNLSEGEGYETPYELGAHQVSRDYFSIHTLARAMDGIPTAPAWLSSHLGTST